FMIDRTRTRAQPADTGTAVAGLYGDHVRTRQAKAEAALAAAGFDALGVQSGTPFTYYADDMDAPFRSTPHFAHWVPMEGPKHLLLVRAGKKPKLLRVSPDDYWYEQAPLGSPFWAREFDLAEVKSEADAWKAAAPGARTAYVGDSPAE